MKLCPCLPLPQTAPLSFSTIFGGDKNPGAHEGGISGWEQFLNPMVPSWQPQLPAQLTASLAWALLAF